MGIMPLIDTQNEMLAEFETMQLYWYTGTKMVQPMLPWREEDDGTTKYEQFVDGKCVRDYKGGKAIVNLKTVIRKTVKNGNVTERYHAIGFWDNRADLEYVPICHALDPKELNRNPEFVEWVEEPKAAKLHIAD